MNVNGRLQIYILFCLSAILVGCTPVSKGLRDKAEPLTLAEVSRNPAAFKGNIVI